MKNLLSLVLLCSVSQAIAGDYTKIQAGDLAIGSASATLLSVKPLCGHVPGQVSCMAYGSIVKIEVGLQGCLDSLGGYHSAFRMKNGKGVLSFGALNISNRKSMTTRCYRQATVEVDVMVPFEGDIELEILDFTGMTN